jgi:hypothetical protein
MIPEVAALLERIKTEGAFDTLAEILADTSEMILALDNKMAEMPEGSAARIAAGNAFGDSENLCDGLIEAMTLLPSDGIASAVVHLVLASDMLDQANSWADETEQSERGRIRLEQTLEAAIRSLNFALPALLALPEAKLARRIAKRYVSDSVRGQPEERAAS